MKKRILSVLLALCMCLTFVPVSVFAEDLQQDNSISVLSITPDEGTYYTYVFTVDGKEINRQIVKNGDTLLEPKVPAQDGKVFTGWDKTVPFGVIDGLAGDNQTITVNAQFKDGYHVYFKDNNGRIIATKTVENGTKVTFEDVKFPVGSDEAITGWYKDADRTKKVDSVTINGADITLYAKVEKGHWITFESNGGSYVEPKFFVTSANTKEPTDPTKPGYAFAGWYNGKDQYTFGNTLTENIELKAHWTAQDGVKYTVIHWLENADDDGYSYEESETKTGTTGGQTNAKAKSYTGFTAQTITQETIKGDGSTIVSVKYTRNVYEVKFFTDRNGKNEDTSLRITAKYGANISDKWPGGGWYVSPPSMWSSTAQSNIDTMPLNGKNFYGQQSGYQTYNAYYYTEVLPGQTGDTTVGSRTYKLDHTDTIQAGRGLKVTDEERYPITGFTCNTDVSTKNGQSYNGAKFYYTRNSYDLVFISGGKTVKTESVKYQASIADYASNKPGNAPAGMEDYVFAGWYASQECTGEAYDFTGKTMPANNITLYAKWVAPTYTVTVYDQNGTKLDGITVSKGDTVTDELSKLEAQLKLTLDTGDSFLGWTINRGLPFNPGTKITANYELYAKVGNSTGYSVTYAPNGGAGSVTDTEKYAKGAEATVKSNNGFTNGDKVFLSWNTAADGTGKTYYPNSTVEITGDVTLYAQWGDKASTVSVTYHSNFGTDQTKMVKDIANNGQITVEDYSATGLPAREGYTFAGWKNNEGTSFSANDSARVNKDGPNDLYAQWTPNTNTAYKVEFYYQGDDGSYPSTASKTEPRTGTTDATVSVTDADKADKENGKYTFDKDNTANVESGTVAADGSLVLKLYFKLNQADVTVNYYWNETTNTVATSKTLTAQTVGSVITTETAIAIEGYTALPNQTCNLTVGADASKNVINFYYKNVELTANSKTETYDGTEKSVSGFTSKVALDSSDVTLTFTPAITVGAKGTNVGTYPANFAEGTEGTVDTTEKYIVTKATPGKPTITQPSHPTRPSTPTKDVTSVKTADGSQMTLWMSMMLASAAGIVFLGKKRKEEQ